nr:EOG090X0APF [Eulimnadia texana]
MEFPDLGKHCSEKSCNLLDFLPMNCDACSKTFCKDHLRYESHSCESSYKKNVQVPVCPLCNNPVSWKRGEAPDISVSEHIDRDCQSDPAQQKRKVFGNKCRKKGCKQKELVPIVCNQCKLNYCLKHRHPTDHSCGGNNPANKAREAALARASASTSSSSVAGNTGGIASWFSSQQQRRPNITAIQGSMSEDEALARALQASLQQSEKSPKDQQEEADRLLALSLQQAESGRSQPATTASPSAASSNDKCIVS